MKEMKIHNRASILSEKRRVGTRCCATSLSQQDIMIVIVKIEKNSDILEDVHDSVCFVTLTQ